MIFIVFFFSDKKRIASKSVKNSSDLPSCGSNLRKRYTLRLLAMCLKEGRGWKLFCLGGANDLPLAKKGLSGGTRVWGNYTD